MRYAGVIIRLTFALMGKKPNRLEQLRAKIERGMKRHALKTNREVEEVTGIDRVKVHRIRRGADPRYSVAMQLLDALEAE